LSYKREEERRLDEFARHSLRCCNCTAEKQAVMTETRMVGNLDIVAQDTLMQAQQTATLTFLGF